MLVRLARGQFSVSQTGKTTVRSVLVRLARRQFSVSQTGKRRVQC